MLRSASRRQFLHLMPGASLALWLCIRHQEPTYAVGPVRVVVGFPPGGAADIGTAHLVSRWLSGRIGSSSSRKPAGSGDTLRRRGGCRSAPADGRTLLLVGLTNTVNATLYDSLNFDFIRDVAPVVGLVRGPLRDRGEFLGARDDGPRADRLRQSQPRRSRYGIGRRRNPSAIWPRNSSNC